MAEEQAEQIAAARHKVLIVDKKFKPEDLKFAEINSMSAISASA